MPVEIKTNKIGPLYVSFYFIFLLNSFLFCPMILSAHDRLKNITNLVQNQ